jgi:hypothetical protein
VATLFAFVEKYKFLAILKITSMLFPVSFASVSLPQVATSWNPDGPNPVILSLSDLAGGASRTTSTIQAPNEVSKRHLIPSEYYAKVSKRSVLYDSTEKGLVRSHLTVEEGTWVLAGSQVAEGTGRRWINVMLPNSNGKFVPEDCATGYIQLANIGEKSAFHPPSP